MKITDKEIEIAQASNRLRNKGLERMLVLKGGFATTMKDVMLGGLNTKFMSRLQ